MDSNDPTTVSCAFKQRLFRDTPKIDSKELLSFARFVGKYVRSHYDRVEPLGFEEWLEGTSYNEQRKEQLRKIRSDDEFCRPTIKRCQHIDTFVKTESYPEYKHARMINSRCDSFKVWSGPWFKAIEKMVYADHHFIKHVPVKDRPALINGLKQAGLHYFETDYTSFEASFAPSLMRACECQLYSHAMGYTEDSKFLNAVITGPNKMRTRSGCKATVRGRRMSGDMCTSLGNGFTNLMLALYFADKHGLVLDGYVEGDDGIFATKDVLRSADFAKLGFNIKIKEVDDPCCASFCGMVFSDSGEIIREPRDFLANFAWTSSFINGSDKLMQQLLRAKALSCVYETPQCPIVGALARIALHNTTGVVPRFVSDGYHVPHDVRNVPEFCPSNQTRELFEHLYGISVDAQLLIEDLITKEDMDGVASALPPSNDMFGFSLAYQEMG
jgi:hypothetical protein